MAAETGFQKPEGRVVGRGSYTILEKTVETGTSCVPGAAVKYGSTQAEIVVNDTSSNEIVGFLSWEHANPTDRPSTIDTAYATGARAPIVLIGSGVPIRAVLGKNQTITAGEALTCGSTAVDGAGSLKEATIGTDNVVAYALEDVTTTTAVATIWVNLV